LWARRIVIVIILSRLFGIAVCIHHHIAISTAITIADRQNTRRLTC
jgi:hypothetical protein